MSFWHHLGHDIQHARASQVAATAAVVGGISAVAAAVNGSRTLRRARTDSADRSRPYVIAEFRDRELAHMTILFVVRNLGQTEARNLKVAFTPDLPVAPEDQVPADTIKFIKRRYANPIKLLAPGQELDNTYSVGEPQPDEVRSPKQVTVALSYDGPNNRHYETTFELDTELLSTRTYVTSSSDPSEQMKVVIKHLATIAGALNGELEVVTETRAEMAQRHEERQQEFEEQMKAYEERQSAQASEAPLAPDAARPEAERRDDPADGSGAP